MTDDRQIQFQLFSRPVWPASLRTLELSGPSYVPARTVFSASLTRSVDMLQPGSIGSDFLEDKSPDRQILSVGHHVCSPRVEDHSTRIGFDDVQNLFAGSANEDR